jgi:phosphoserine aminotransferase
MRASIYNAMGPESGVDALIAFMQRVRAANTAENGSDFGGDGG